MARERVASPRLVSTSVHLSRMLDRAEGVRVSVGWLMGELGERSFGLTLLVMAVLALLPGASTFVGLLIAWPAIQLILGHETAALPRVLARREVGVARLARVIGVVVPRLAWAERLIRPRWPELFQNTRRLTGTAILLVGSSRVDLQACKLEYSIVSPK